MAEARGSRTHPSRVIREAAGFEDREGHRTPLASDRSVMANRPGDSGRLFRVCLAVEQADFGRSWTLGRFLRCELDPLAFP